jgi:hypothetical protein
MNADMPDPAQMNAHVILRNSSPRRYQLTGELQEWCCISIDQAIIARDHRGITAPA